MNKSFPKISAVIITKNAQRCLEKVLISLRDIVDEIVIVDDHSTDNTLVIAKKYHARVISQRWLGFGPQKNLGIDSAKNNWVISLDADEVISQELANDIKNASFNRFDGFKFKFRTYFASSWVRHCGWYPRYHLRLFRKDKMRFDNKPVHEAIKEVGRIGKLHHDIYHYSYTSNSQYFKKIEGYTTLDAQFLYHKKRPWNIIYQIGKPIKEFFQIYIGKKGYLDGLLGLKISYFSAIYRYKVAKKLHLLYKQSITKKGKQ